MLPGEVGDHGRATTTTPATQPVLIRLKFIYEYLFMKVWYVKVHQGLPYQGMLPGEVGDHGRTIVIADRAPRSAIDQIRLNR